jgi:hypothetical protein
MRRPLALFPWCVVQSRHRELRWLGKVVLCSLLSDDQLVPPEPTGKGTLRQACVYLRPERLREVGHAEL